MEEFKYRTADRDQPFSGQGWPHSLIGVAKNELGFQDEILLIWDFSKLLKVKPVNITSAFLWD